MTDHLGSLLEHLMLQFDVGWDNRLQCVRAVDNYNKFVGHNFGLVADLDGQSGRKRLLEYPVGLVHAISLYHH